VTLLSGTNHETFVNPDGTVEMYYFTYNPYSLEGATFVVAGSGE